MKNKQQPVLGCVRGTHRCCDLGRFVEPLMRARDLTERNTRSCTNAYLTLVETRVLPMRTSLLTATAITIAAIPLSPTIALADQGDLLVRVRAIAVAPNDDAGGIEPGIPTGSIDVEPAYVPEIDFTYFIRDRIAAELILATSQHDIVGTDAVSGLGTVGDVGVLPPTLTLQYHFAPDAEIRPYAGIGVNYTLFYGEDTSDSLNGALGDTKLELDSSVGLALQAGVDVDVLDNWFLNFDLKYIQIETEATLRTGDVVNAIDVDLNPFVVGVGFGRKF